MPANGYNKNPSLPHLKGFIVYQTKAQISEEHRKAGYQVAKSVLKSLEQMRSRSDDEFRQQMRNRIHERE